MNTLSSRPLSEIFSDATTKTWPRAESPIVIYGAGQKGRQLGGLLQAQGVEVVAFLDRAAVTGQTWRDVPVLHPDTDAARTLGARHTVLVAIHNYRVDLSELLDELAICGFPRVLSPIALQNALGEILPRHYWLDSVDAYLPNVEPITAGYELFREEKSREIFRRVLDYRINGRYGCLPQPVPGDQYAPLDLPGWGNPMRLVDCGAYDGDTITRLAQRGFTIEAVAAFEPDPDNYRKLVAIARNRESAFCFPCAVAASACHLRFSSGQGMASHIEESGDVFAQCVALDEAIPNFAPTLIKMDIEGAEYEALLGGASLIQRYRPGLALSAYHHPAHLWELALLIDSWRLDYEFFLRAHAHNTFDLVLYASPKQH